MRSAYDIDWSAFPAVFDDAYDPEKVAPAIEALKSVSSQTGSGQPYQDLLYTIANNHGGFLYPASYAASPLIGEILVVPGWPRSTALAVLAELASFEVPATFSYGGAEVDYVAAAAEMFESLRSRVQDIADGPHDGAGSCDAARKYIEALDNRGPRCRPG